MIAQQYQKGQTSGWLGEKLAREQFDLFGGKEFKPYMSVSRAETKVRLYDAPRKLLGRDILNYAQRIGACVAYGMKNALEILQCVEILWKGDAEQFKHISTAYLYGCGRVFVGGGQLGCNQDGSLGYWQAEAVKKYGVLPISDLKPDLTEEQIFNYLKNDSSEIANLERQYGCRSGPPKNLVDKASIHLIKGHNRVNTIEDYINSISSLSPVTIASNVGYEMQARNGVHRRSGRWDHQMMGESYDMKSETAVIRNSWGEDAHGKLFDFDDNSPIPLGCLRISFKDLESMLVQGDSHSISLFDGYQDRSKILTREDFRIF
jgi:hypothetical protein